MRRAEAVVSGGKGNAAAKLAALEMPGVTTAKSAADVGKTIARLM